MAIYNIVPADQDYELQQASVADASGKEFTIQAQGNNSATLAAGDLVLRPGVNAGAGDGGAFSVKINSSAMFTLVATKTDQHIWLDAHATATGATTGANGDVPAQVDGYLRISIGGTRKKIPYYND